MKSSLKRICVLALVFLCFSSCEKEESCIFQRSPQPYNKVDLIVCNDGRRIDTNKYDANACQNNDGIDGAYFCDPI